MKLEDALQTEAGHGHAADLNDRELLLSLFEAALAAAGPDGKFEGRLPPPPKGRLIVIGAGKAAARMARAFEDAAAAEWGRACEGLVVTRYGHGHPTRHIEVVEAAHPVPDAAGQAAARRILDLARAAGPDDLVVALISGGASALLALPAEGLTLADKQALNAELLKSGAPISVMNKVRKAVSAIKGGRLAAAIAPARAVTYLISDVPGDDPAAIGSGPTIPVSCDPEEVLSALRAHGITPSAAVERVIRANILPEGCFPNQTVEMLATPLMALEAAAEAARAKGLSAMILGDALEGEACTVGTVLAGIATSVAAHGLPAPAPMVLLSGGETTVRVTGNGQGGRNGEFLLAFLLALNGHPGISALACDTDGIDGSCENAGAWGSASSLTEARSCGLDPARLLSENDSHRLFSALGHLIVTGPTLTNVNDFRAILVR